MAGIKLYTLEQNEDELDDIKQSLWVLLFTSKGERIYQPDYGVGVLDYIDRPHYQAQRLMVDIAEAVDVFETRVKLSKLDILPTDLNQGRITVVLTCIVIATGQQHSLTFNEAGPVSSS